MDHLYIDNYNISDSRKYKDIIRTIPLRRFPAEKNYKHTRIVMLL